MGSLMPPATLIKPLAGASEVKSSEQPDMCREAPVSNSQTGESLTEGRGIAACALTSCEGWASVMSTAVGVAAEKV
jgi:hypothetical protein